MNALVMNLPDALLLAHSIIRGTQARTDRSKWGWSHKNKSRSQYSAATSLRRPNNSARSKHRQAYRWYRMMVTATNLPVTPSLYGIGTVTPPSAGAAAVLASASVDQSCLRLVSRTLATTPSVAIGEPRPWMRKHEINPDNGTISCNWSTHQMDRGKKTSCRSNMQGVIVSRENKPANAYTLHYRQRTKGVNGPVAWNSIGMILGLLESHLKSILSPEHHSASPKKLFFGSVHPYCH
jgi:hypothetical protein